jgi:hypothetical protein
MGREALEWAQSTGILTVVQLSSGPNSQCHSIVITLWDYRPVGISTAICGSMENITYLMMEWVVVNGKKVLRFHRGPFRDLSFRTIPDVGHGDGVSLS